MTTDPLFFFFVVLFCLCLEALFSGSEMALLASDINRIRQRARSGSRGAAVALKLLEKPEWFLAVCLTGTDLCIIIGTAMATSLSMSVFGIARGELIAVCVMIPLLVVFGEIVPKSIFQQRAESVAVRISWFIYAASRVLYPLVYIVSKISRGAVYMLTSRTEDTYSPYITKEGLRFLLKNREAESDLRGSEKEMVRRIFDFSESTVGKVMVPLSNVAVLDEESPLRDAARLINKTGFSRIPVCRDNVISITGILHAFDVLKALPSLADKPVSLFVSPGVFYVPETKSAGDLLVEMQRKGIQMAIVVDEYGGTTGIVTVEDILEEIVGEIEDEYDRTEKTFKKVGAGRYLFDARISLDRLRELIDQEIPPGDYETLAGYLLHRLGRIPKRSETLREGKVLFIIEDADVKSIKEVLVALPQDMEIKKRTE